MFNAYQVYVGIVWVEKHSETGAPSPIAGCKRAKGQGGTGDAWVQGAEALGRLADPLVQTVGLGRMGVICHGCRYCLSTFLGLGAVLGGGGEGVWWPGLWISTVLERGGRVSRRQDQYCGYCVSLPR